MNMFRVVDGAIVLAYVTVLGRKTWAVRTMCATAGAMGDADRPTLGPDAATPH
jgi:hypothetical protein